MSEEARVYEITGCLTVENWELVESTLGKLGINMTLQPPKFIEEEVRLEEPWTPEEVSEDSLTKEKFLGFANSSPKFNENLANRTWCMLAQIYASKFFKEHWQIWRITDKFVDAPLEYEVTPPESIGSFFGYWTRLDGLRPESLAAFANFLDKEILLNGKIESQKLPYGMGKRMVEFIRALNDELSPSSE